MRKHKVNLPSLLKSDDWSLFLDRDGVINQRLVDDYVKNTNEFRFTNGFTHALSALTPFFKHIVVVTNQQGVGKGLMTEDTLSTIHQHMVAECLKEGGRIDHVFYCPDLKERRSLNRKPNIGMGLQARKAFPHIRFNRSVMAGDSLTDMEFGRKLKMVNVFIDNGDPSPLPCHLADFRFRTFSEFSKWLTENL